MNDCEFKGQDIFRTRCNIPTTETIITGIEPVEFHNEGEHLWKRVLGVDGYFRVTAEKRDLTLEE